MKTKKSKVRRPDPKERAAFLNSRQKQVLKHWDYYCMTAVLEDEFLLDLIDKMTFLWLFNLAHGKEPVDIHHVLFYLTESYLIRKREPPFMVDQTILGALGKGWKKSIEDHVGRPCDPKN